MTLVTVVQASVDHVVADLLAQVLARSVQVFIGHGTLDIVIVLVHILLYFGQVLVGLGRGSESVLGFVQARSALARLLVAWLAQVLVRSRELDLIARVLQLIVQALA